MDWSHLYQISDSTITSRMVQSQACVAEPSSAEAPHLANIGVEWGGMFRVYLDWEGRSRCLCFWELPQERSEQAESAKSTALVADCNPPIVRAAFGSPWSVSAALHAIFYGIFRAPCNALPW